MPKDTFDNYLRLLLLHGKKEALLQANQTPTFLLNQDGKTIPFPRSGMNADRHWNKYHTFDWGPIDLPDHYFKDHNSTENILKELKKPNSQPTFFSIGYHFPHQPFMRLKGITTYTPSTK